MSNTEDVTVEATVDDADIDVKVEDAVETEVEETEVDEISPETESEETEAEEPQETVEEKAKRLELETEGKQKAIDRKTAALHKANENYAKAMEQINYLQAQINQKQEAVEPDIDDFDTHEEYVNALTDFKAEKKIQENQSKILEMQKQQEFQKIKTERDELVAKQEAEYTKINPKYNAAKQEFFSFLASQTIPQAVESAVVDQSFKGNVPYLINYFGSNNGERLEELQAITKMQPIEAAVEIYKIQQKLETPKKQETKPAPKPITKVKGTSKVSKKLDDLSGDELLKQLGLKK